MKSLTRFIKISIFAALIFMGGVIQVSAAELCSADHVRWASSSNRIYVTGDTVCSIEDIKQYASSSVPLELVDPVAGAWHLGANLFIQDGATVLIHGPAAGGSVSELRLKSNNIIPGDFIEIRADWGSIDIDSTKIISWDDAVSGPDTEYEAMGRAYIRARSSLALDGVTPKESRMDIKNSEIAYLGYQGSEAYGLTWKALGLEEYGLGVFDILGVYGDVVNSNIHHNHFGIYTYGAEGMTFVGNEVHHNNIYGIDPHDDSDYLLIDGNHTHNNGTHGIICSKRCNDLTITNNISEYNGANGIMIHRTVEDSLLANNTTNHNGDTGIAVFDSSDNVIRDNISRFNDRGIRLSVGSENNLIENNDLSFNATYGIYTYKGSDLPTNGDGRIKHNSFVNNLVEENGDFAAKFKEADHNTFRLNSFRNNAKGFYLSGGSPFANSFLENNFADNGTSYNIKFYNADETIFTGNTLAGSKYGILVSGTDRAEVRGNTVTETSKTGIRLQSASIDNVIQDNVLSDNDRGIDIVGGSSGNQVSGNSITGAESYAIYVQGASGNTLFDNPMAGNDMDYYYMKSYATNTILAKSADLFRVKNGESTAVTTISNPDGGIIDNTKAIDTTISPDVSLVEMNWVNSNKSRVDVLLRPLFIQTSALAVQVKLHTWEVGALSQYRKWYVSSGVLSSGVVSVQLGDLIGGITYDVLIDGTPSGSFVANGDGFIQFQSNLAFPGTYKFEVLAK
jgi:parallel beta-helix repeat protein